MTIKVCPVCSVSWYADKPEKHMMTCTAVSPPVGHKVTDYLTRTPLTTEEREAFDNALKGSLDQSNEVSLLGCVHKWDFITDKCLKCGATYQWATNR